MIFAEACGDLLNLKVENIEVEWNLFGPHCVAVASLWCSCCVYYNYSSLTILPEFRPNLDDFGTILIRIGWVGNEPIIK